MDDMIAEFIEETNESLESLDQEVVRLEQEPDDEKLLSSVFRIMHTIKGTCGFLGFGRLEAVAHAAEDILGKVRDGEMRLSSDGVSLILESLDCINEIMGQLAEMGEEPEGDDGALIDRLHVYAESTGGDTGEAASSEMAEPDHDEVPEEAPAEMDELEAAFANAEIDSDLQDMLASNPYIQAAQQQSASGEPQESAESPELAASQAPAEPAPEKPTAVKNAGGGNAAGAQSIRVSIDTLESLMQMVSELVLTRNQLLQMVRDMHDSEFAQPLQRLSLITSELQEGVMQTRMQPICNAWAKFPRIIRDLSNDLGKKIELKMEGGETELDRQLLELIRDPLTHMVRNSADHGVELPADRRQAGKPETGTIFLNASHEGGHIIIEIGDDGRGVNVEKVKEKAIKNGLATPEQIEQMSDLQIMQFIFQPGFSTAEQVTNVSGRGVGMDVVRTNIEKIGGNVTLRSEPGKGSTFIIKIPLTLAIVSVLIVLAGKQKFAIPQMNIQEMVRVTDGSDYRIETINDTPILRIRGKLLPLVSLSQVLGPSHGEVGGQQFIVVCKVEDHQFGLIVDKVFDTEEIVVKPVANVLQHLDVYGGCTILGDGSVIMILNPNRLAQESGIDNKQHGMDEESGGDSTNIKSSATSFLIFRACGNGTPYAVPLELVARLEEVDTTKIERSAGRPVIQYRDGLMHLVNLDYSLDFPDETKQEIIVFSEGVRLLGIAVEEILDIVNEEINIKPIPDRPELMGSMVIGEKTTDVINVGHYMKHIFGDLTEIITEANDPEENQAKILLVEDSGFFRNLMVPLLISEGYNVTPAVHGIDALRLLEESQDYDLIVTDIDMPEMNGFELAETCQKDERLNTIPMIAFTANAKDGAEERGLRAGFLSYITKTDHGQLIATVSDILKERR